MMVVLVARRGLRVRREVYCKEEIGYQTLEKAANMPVVAAPMLAHVCDLSVAVAVPLSIGEVGLGERRIVEITGGEVTGPRLQGHIRPGGADVQIIRQDGLTELAARYVIETSDGALIYVENLGIRTGPAEAMERLRRGEQIDPVLIYFRATPRFETAAPAHRWLMQRLFLCSGMRRPDRVVLSVFEVS
jgi:hypothetical protein